MVRLEFPYLVISPIILYNAIANYYHYDKCPGIPIPNFPITYGKLYVLCAVILCCSTLNILPKPKFTPSFKFVSSYDQTPTPYKSLIVITLLPIPMMLMFIYVLFKNNTCMSYDNILLFSIFYGLYIIAFVFAANFVKTEYRKSEDEAKKYEYLKDSELHDGKKNVYQRIIDDKYFDYARYIKMQDKKL
jgi:hypothetical protein